MEDAFWEDDVGGTAVIRCICEANNTKDTHTHTRETATAGSGQLTNKENAARSAAPLPPCLSRYVQLRLSSLHFQIIICVVVNINSF